MIERAAAVIADRPLRVVTVVLAVTALLVVPLVAMQPTEVASQEPGGPAFTARDVLERRLTPASAPTFWIIEAAGASPEVADGPTDALAPQVLREVHARSERARTTLADVLGSGFSPGAGVSYEGLFTIADAADAALAPLGGIQDASDAAVRQAVDRVVDQVGPVAAGLSVDADVGPDGHWRAEALFTEVLLDTEAVGAAPSAVFGAPLEPERAVRDVRDVLRGGAPGDAVALADGGPVAVHSVAGDANLTAEEQGQATAPFIGLTVLLTLLLVGLVFRSYWRLAVVGGGLAALMVWLFGLANLIGLDEGQILTTVVPIALISFGVDFAFHALGRVGEEAAHVGDPRRALRVGLAGVGGALVLALASDASAFLANTVSGIEEIVQFGIAAALGLGAAFLLLGVAAPVAVTAIEERIAPPRPGVGPTVLRLGGALSAAALTVGSVLLTVFVSAPAGVGLLALLLAVHVVGPVVVLARRDDPAAAAPPSSTDTATIALPGVARLIGALTERAGRAGRLLLPLAAVITVVATLGAMQVQARFDVQDFFAPDSDFVIGLDALDRRLGPTGGEPTREVVLADLTDPDVVARLATEVDELRDLDGSLFAADRDGRVLVDGGVVDLVRDAARLPAASAALAASGADLTDADGDGIPEDGDALAAIYELATTQGLAADDTTVPWRPARVAGVVDLGGGDEQDATVLGLQLPGSREVTTIEAATAVLDPRAAALTTSLQEVDSDASATPTGPPIVRQRSLEAVTRALLLSLPIAIALCFAVAWAAMRSLRFAGVAIVPIVLVAPWLYGTMHALGFSVNLVTGTIGALSIGIGIDFAIHLVERFREEHAELGGRDAALRATGEGTGVALVASAVSSSVGFAALALAPMPLFASFGLLTALMIAMALLATLMVLPSLLRAVTTDHQALDGVARRRVDARGRPVGTP